MSPLTTLLQRQSNLWTAKNYKAVQASAMLLTTFSIAASVGTRKSPKAGSNTTTSCESVPNEKNPKRPPVFGASIADLSTSTTSSRTPSDTEPKYSDNLKEAISEDRENCPICDKYSQGPCGGFFQDWLKCTDKYAGKTDPKTNDELHLTKCSELAGKLARCLEKHEDYYEKVDVDQKENEEQSSAELKQAWERLIQEDIKDVPRDQFPAFHTPGIELRPSDRLGIVSFEMTDIDDLSLLLVYVQDATSGELLCAATPADLWKLTEKGRPMGILQCHVPYYTSQLTACAMYEDQHDPFHQIIYTYTANVTVSGPP